MRTHSPGRDVFVLPAKDRRTVGDMVNKCGHKIIKRCLRSADKTHASELLQSFSLERRNESWRKTAA